jgi:RNA polymerase sigma-70 factor (ECF subfamily)
LQTPEHAPPSPADLVVRAAGGDRVALGELLRKLGPGMVRTATKVTGSRADAEDAVQEAMLQLARSLGGLKEPRAIAAYASRIVLRTALRSRRRVRPEHDEHDDLDELASELHSTDEMLERRRQVERALGLLERLPEEQAEVMMMHCVEGYTVAEVAEAMGVSFHTITSRVRLAKQHLERLRGRTSPRRALELAGGALK